MRDGELQGTFPRMRLVSDEGDYVELLRREHEAYDLSLEVSVQRRGFRGSTRVWIDRAAWHAFAQALAVLETQRQGTARLEGASPEDLSLTIKSVGHAGHLAVEGNIAVRSFDSDVKLSFSAFAFEPSQLVAFAAEARALSEVLAR